jgi:hypothetical protein
VVDPAGVGLAAQEVTVDMTPLEGGVSTGSVSGVVPESATVALIAVRVNAEDAVPGDANIRIYDFRYPKDDGQTNLVPNGDLARGDESWGFYGELFPVTPRQHSTSARPSHSTLVPPGQLSLR